MPQIHLTDPARCEEPRQNVEIMRGHEPADPAVIRKLPRIGIYEPSRSPSGPSRYVDGILSSIDLKEFEFVLFGHQDGPHQSLGIPIVECSDAPEGTRAQQAGKEGPDPGRGSRRTWRRFIPSTVRLWAGYSRNCLSLASTFRSHPVDLLHTNNTGCEESAIAARLAGVPRVLGTFHVDSTYDLHKTRDGFRYRIIEHLSNHCLHKAIAVSEATRSDWMRRTHLSGNRVIAISNGVDLQVHRRRGEKEDARARLGLPSDGRVLLGGAGRLEEAKGFSYLLDAIALLAGERQDFDLALAGTGPLRGTLEDHAAALGITHRVHFLGFRHDVREVYEALDVFVLPSLCEAMPYALLEAMAMRLPVVGSAVGGVPQVMASGETGFVVPSRDSRPLAEAIQSLLSSADLREKLGRAARARSERLFDLKDSVRRTIQVYRDMLCLDTTTE